jgi:TRAP transporter 4TM/12TM fusion protein
MRILDPDNKGQRWYYYGITIISYIVCIIQIGYIFVPTVIKSFSFTVLHLTFGLVVCFLVFDIKGKARNFSGILKIVDIVLALMAVVISVYILPDPDEFMTRIQIRASRVDVVMGIITLIIVLESCRRMTGPALPVIALIFIAYSLWGGNLPGILGHKGYSINRIVTTVFSQQGIFGGPLTVSATILFIFLLFGAFLNASGADVIFKNLAVALTGRRRGGPAKIAVIASAIFGTISGSAVANVVSTGAFTIPLMKRQGYRSEFAGAVEAAASTGGQIMPPIMGAAAFLLSDMIGVPYRSVCVAALVPALMYYICLFIMVDVESLRHNLKGMDAKDIPALAPVLRTSAKLLIPVLMLIIVLVFSGQSPSRSALFAIASLIVCSLLDRNNRFNFSMLSKAFTGCARSVAQICSACATAGIVIGVLSVTGLGLKLSTLVFQLGGTNVFLSLILAMIVSVILGMGLPASAAYIITAVTISASLIRMGLPVMATHLFLLYFSCASNITPPVAIASYAGAAIAEASPNKVSYEAMKLGSVAFIVPFAFVMNPLLISFDFSSPLDTLQTVFDFGCAILMAFPLAYGIQGYIHRRINIFLRCLLVAMGIGLVSPFEYFKVGIVLLFGLFFFFEKRRSAGGIKIN